MKIGSGHFPCYHLAIDKAKMSDMGQLQAQINILHISGRRQGNAPLQLGSYFTTFIYIGITWLRAVGFMSTECYQAKHEFIKFKTTLFVPGGQFNHCYPLNTWCEIRPIWGGYSRTCERLWAAKTEAEQAETGRGKQEEAAADGFRQTETSMQRSHSNNKARELKGLLLLSWLKRKMWLLMWKGTISSFSSMFTVTGALLRQTVDLWTSAGRFRRTQVSGIYINSSWGEKEPLKSCLNKSVSYKGKFLLFS